MSFHGIIFSFDRMRISRKGGTNKQDEKNNHVNFLITDRTPLKNLVPPIGIAYRYRSRNKFKFVNDCFDSSPRSGTLWRRPWQERNFLAPSKFQSLTPRRLDHLIAGNRLDKGRSQYVIERTLEGACEFIACSIFVLIVEGE